jgi:hypothetical protein
VLESLLDRDLLRFAVVRHREGPECRKLSGVSMVRIRTRSRPRVSVSPSMTARQARA